MAKKNKRPKRRDDGWMTGEAAVREQSQRKSNKKIKMNRQEDAKTKGAKAKESFLRARSREIAEQATRSGVTPLEVMLTNMRWAHNHSVDLLIEFEEFLKAGTEKKLSGGSTAEENKEMDEGARDLMRQFIRMRELAQRFAVDAAPFIHPRLAQVEWRPDGADKSIAAIQRVVIDPRDANTTGIPPPVTAEAV